MLQSQLLEKIDMTEFLDIDNIPALLKKEMKGKSDLTLDVDAIMNVFSRLYHHDPATAIHSIEVACLSLKLGKFVFPQNQWDHIFWGGLLHDIGKLSFHSYILEGNTPLKEEDWAIIYHHPQIGYQIAQEFITSGIILDMILHHHENMNGSGYPHRLNGVELSPFARIARIADMCSALSHSRKYREKSYYPIDETLQIIQNQMECFDKRFISLLEKSLLPGRQVAAK